MNIQEAIKQLESLKEDRKSFIEDEVEHDSIFMQDYEAIDTVLQALEKFQKENEKYISGELMTRNQAKHFEETTKKYYIHKDKIKDRIKHLKEIIRKDEEELKKNPDPVNSRFYSFDAYFEWERETK